MCTNSMLYGSVPAYVIPEGYMHHSNLYKIYACMFNSRRICAQVLYSDFLTIFYERSTGMLKDSLGSIILWKNVSVMILTYHEVLMMYGPRRRG